MKIKFENEYLKEKKVNVYQLNKIKYTRELFVTGNLTAIPSNVHSISG